MTNTFRSEDFITFCLQEHVLSFGDFKLKSGRQSPYFFNAGHFQTGFALSQLGYFYAAKLVETQIQFDVLFGPAYKGISLGVATAVALATHFNVNVEVAFNRKEVKDHGEGGNLIGAPLANKRVVLIDDVITAGTAAKEVLPLIRHAGGTIVAMILALNRQEKIHANDTMSAVQKLASEEQFNIYALTSLQEILHFVSTQPECLPHLDAIANYQREWGV